MRSRHRDRDILYRLAHNTTPPSQRRAQRRNAEIYLAAQWFEGEALPPAAVSRHRQAKYVYAAQPI